MRANLVTSDKSEGVTLHFEHAVDRGIGYGQLWIDGRFHLELTESGLRALAAEALELAEGL